MKSISVCIPTYEMKDKGHIFLEESFKTLENQTFKDFEVVISDHSKNNLVMDLCTKYKDRLNIHYYRNNNNLGSSSANINNAIKKANGKLIKILFQDDFLFNEKSLEEIINNFDMEKDFWMITACTRSKDGKTFLKPFYPKYNTIIHFGNNTISSPSVLTIKNTNPLLFDENLLWLMDVDYYKRCYNKYGNPKIINTINVVNRIGPYQVSNSIVNTQIKLKEIFYIFKKYYFKK